MWSASLPLILLSVACSLVGQELVDFRRDIEPIFRARCSNCHGAQQQLSGLRLDSREAALRGGYSGVAVRPGDSAGSRLIELVSGKGKLVMPPAGTRLDEREMQLLRNWIDQGAGWPADGPAMIDARRVSTHWSLQALRKPAVPPAKDEAWLRNTIDAFVLARLKREGVNPSPPVDRRMLLRRLSLDLTGLPPTPQEIAEFLGDTRPDAEERVIDRLLASPHYGEKWARHWLDLARYADSDGYEQDQVRPHAWRYRDWVIRAFNANMPFDRFTVEQIAGDLLPRATLEQKAATGFHRNTLTSREGGIDVEQLRTEQVTDRAATVATVWLGLTFECARCHDHKYDPITQKEFYQLYAFFDSAVEVNLEDPVPGELDHYRRTRSEYEKNYLEIRTRHRVDELQPQWEREALAAMAEPAARLEWIQVVDYLQVYQDHGHEILKMKPEARTFRQVHDLTRVFLKYPGPLSSWPAATDIKFSEGFKQLEELDARYPGLSEIPTIAEGTPRKTQLFIRGDFRNPGIEVQPGTPAVLPPLPSGVPPNRLALARWLVAPENPLTARVVVNRIWQELFGRGLVRTSEDLGTRGAPPSHPELLDWLAVSFRDGGWNMKSLIRDIVLSATYRQSSHARDDLATRDPENQLLARQARFRLPAELIRDAALSSSGLLNPSVGGRSIRPPLPAEMLRVAYRVKWEESQGADRYRRGVYTLFQRSLPHPQMASFDAPSSLLTCSRRERSVTPLQALNLLNAPEFSEAARALGARILHESAGGFEERLQYGYELCLGRPPSGEEVAALARYYDSRMQRPDVWTGVAAILLNLDEFITRE
jgi:hypothetical protein